MEERCLKMAAKSNKATTVTLGEPERDTANEFEAQRLESLIAKMEAELSATEEEGQAKAEAATSDIDREVIRTALAAVLRRKVDAIEVQRLHLEAARERQHEANLAHHVASTEPARRLNELGADRLRPRLADKGVLDDGLGDLVMTPRMWGVPARIVDLLRLGVDPRREPARQCVHVPAGHSGGARRHPLRGRLPGVAARGRLRRIPPRHRGARSGLAGRGARACGRGRCGLRRARGCRIRAFDDRGGAGQLRSSYSNSPSDDLARRVLAKLDEEMPDDPDDSHGPTSLSGGLDPLGTRDDDTADIALMKYTASRAYHSADSVYRALKGW
jgi:hypothetical protein